MLATIMLLLGCTAPAPTAAPTAPEATGTPVARIALTFDDLPYQTRRGGAPLSPEPADWARVNRSILAALAEADAPATVFVNCGNLADDDTLADQWRRAGHTVGNHTAHHSSAAHTDLDVWMAEVRQCDGLWPTESTATRWFRFPYLWRGEGVERRDAVQAALNDAGYRVAPVTVDSHDWMFELVRRQRKETGASDADLAGLGAHYARNTAEAVAEARAISREKLGREAAQILLLHINDTTAAQLPSILAALEAEGIEVVRLDEAMTDPLYAQPDAWAGRGARWWLARTDPVARPDGSPWYSDREGTLGKQLGWP